MKRISSKKIERLPTKNGMVNEELINFIKESILYDSIRSSKQLVKHKQQYPQNNTSVVEFETDFIIMSINEFEKLNNGDFKKR